MRFRLVGEGLKFKGPFARANGESDLRFTRADILRAATLTGRTRRDATRFGAQSRLETRWRLAAIQLALDLEPPADRIGYKFFRHPPQWKRLDGSEKGALNFTLGCVVAKLMAEKCLNAPLLLHHDVYADFLQTRLGKRDQRPDFAGWTNLPNQRWVAIEAKGRMRFPRQTARDGAKDQAIALQRVRNEAVSCHATCWTYESQGRLNAFYEDPAPDDRKGLTLNIEPKQFGAAYYAPLRALLEVAELEKRGETFVAYRVPSLNVGLVLHDKLDGILREPDSPMMENFMKSLSNHEAMASDFPLGPDGVAILPADFRLGDSEGEPPSPEKKK